MYLSKRPSLFELKHDYDDEVEHIKQLSWRIKWLIKIFATAENIENLHDDFEMSTLILSLSS